MFRQFRNQDAILRVRSRIQAGRLASNRCEELATGKPLRVRSRIQAGRLAQNRCEVLVTA